MKTNLERKPATESKSLELVPFYLKLKKILVPIDFSDASKKAFQYAIPLADQFGASVTLLYIVETHPELSYAPFDMERVRMNEIAHERSEKKLKELCPDLGGKSGIKFKTVVRDGRAYEEITKAAEEINADLIVMATHGYTGLKHTVLGSTTERVVRYAKCPVLTVRDLK